MRIGIIGAMEPEIIIIKNLLQQRKEIKVANTFLYTGIIENLEIGLIQSGIGKAMAAMSTSILIEHFQPDIIINTGSAAGFKTGLKVGDVAISTTVKYHDVDVTAFGYVKGQMAASPAEFLATDNLIQLAVKTANIEQERVTVGLICSGDIFINQVAQIQQIKQEFPDVVAVDMEAAAIAHVCYAYNKPFVIIRAISDSGDDKSHISFDEFLPLAAKQSSNLILKMLKQLKNKEL